MWTLYLGLMTVAAGLLPVEKFWRGIDWLLLLALGVAAGLARVLAGMLAPILAGYLDSAEGTAAALLIIHPLPAAFALIMLTAIGCRFLGAIRCAVIVLPVALALGTAFAGEPAGWLLTVLITLHWHDTCAEAPTGARENPLARQAVRLAGLVLIGVAAAAWYRLEVL